MNSPNMSARSSRSLASVASVASLAVGLAMAPSARAEPRGPVELFLGLGVGNAVCGDDRPESDCPVESGGAIALGGGYRFHPHWLVGLELAAWSFGVNDAWRGELPGRADEVAFSSSYLAPFLRWYWFDRGTADPYLMAGIGVGTVTGEAESDDGRYTYRASGLDYLLGIGVEWQVADIFRIGPEGLAYLHVGGEICEDPPGAGETCREPARDERGDREGLALPYRLLAVGTFTLGKP